MLDRHTVVAAYNATDEAADGLALARLLAGLTDTELLIVRVLQGMVDTPGPDHVAQGTIRNAVETTRRSVLAAVPADTAPEQIVPILDARLARGLHDAATTYGADFLVLGSSHHSTAGRILIGGSAATVVNEAPCPVAVAPPGFRDAPQLEPGVIGCAYDGSSESADALRTAVYLASAAQLPLRVISVGHQLDDRLDYAEEVATGMAPGTLTVQKQALAGDPADALLAETDGEIGLLVMGSRGRGALRRALLGSVSTRVLHHAHCPVLITPRRG